MSIEARLQEIKQSIINENISWGEIAELQELAAHIDPDDMELLSWADAEWMGDIEEKVVDEAVPMYALSVTIDDFYYHRLMGEADEKERRLCFVRYVMWRLLLAKGHPLAVVQRRLDNMPIRDKDRLITEVVGCLYMETAPDRWNMDKELEGADFVREIVQLVDKYGLTPQ